MRYTLWPPAPNDRLVYRRSKFNVSVQCPNYPQHSCITIYFHFSIFKVGLFNPGLDAPLGLNPHTLESTHLLANHLSSSPRGALSSSLHLSQTVWRPCEVQDGDKEPHKDASVWRRPLRFGALYSITLVPLRVKMQNCIPPLSEVAPLTLRYQDYGI